MEGASRRRHCGTEGRAVEETNSKQTEMKKNSLLGKNTPISVKLKLANKD